MASWLWILRVAGAPENDGWIEAIQVHRFTVFDL